MKRVNVGCGQTATEGWYNYDNSMSIRLSKHRFLVLTLNKLGLLGESQKQFVLYAAVHGIRWADVRRHIPMNDNSVAVLYASHVVEHLDPEETRGLLQEAKRVLAPGGIIRVVVPDLKKLVDSYIVEGDADSFLEKTLLARPRAHTALDKLKHAIAGDRHHLWMYDGPSMIRLLSRMGFREPQILEPGSTSIPDPVGLNLYERAEESVYVEACK